MSAWIASLITNEFDEKDAAWRHVVNAALHSPVPNMLAAFLKLGLPLGPRLKECPSWGVSQWILRLAEHLASSHTRLSLIAGLPSIADCLVLSSSEAIRALAYCKQTGARDPAVTQSSGSD